MIRALLLVGFSRQMFVTGRLIRLHCTVGDFSAQAVVNTILGHAFPDDRIVGEEDAADMRAESGVGLRNRIVELANETITAPLQPGEEDTWGLGPSHAQTAEQIMDVIDRGNYDGGRTGRAYSMFISWVLYSHWWLGFWTLDPIDGTKGFLRGEQYAVCLALIVDARVELGIIGCPNLPVSASAPTGERGCIFVAVRGQGAYQLPLSPHSTTEPIRLQIPDLAQDQLNLLESVEKAHSKLSFNEKVAQVLGITREPTRMDSQAKYCALVRGDGGVYLRMPTGTGYREKIWVRALD